MATYFQGAPEMQPDGLQTLYLMNPSYVGYPPDTAAQANMVLLNSTVNPLNPMSLGHAAAHQNSQQQQHFVGIPLQQAPSHESNRPPPPSIHSSHDGSAIHGFVPRLHYNLWSPTPPPPNSVDQLGPHRTSAVPPTQQGLSLSLASQEIAVAAAAAVPEYSPASAEEVKLAASSCTASVSANGVSALQSFLMGSKYLKAAQQLLDEVVNVGKGSKGDRGKGPNSKCSMKSSRDSEITGAGAREEDSSMRRGADLTTAERQELQMKKAKLVNMMDEVEQRYRQYHHQMQIVVAYFEAVAGVGSARTYTALALQTISKQFRCLRDAITVQIRATSKSLGEEDPKSVGSRLRFVDHHLRQQRALQQLGMIQHNAWRPQRGLPERSVSILRAWLFEHFLHPYPKDSDKLMLAKQTGLTRSQVSNWFINARVRLWKPMVEEMYAEEVKDQEQNTDEKPSKDDVNEGSSSKSTAQQESSPARAGQTENLQAKQDHLNSPRRPMPATPSSLTDQTQGSSYYGSERVMQPNYKKAKSDKPLQPTAMPHSMSVEMKSSEASNSELLMKFMEGRRGAGGQGYPFIPGSTEHGGGFGAYPIGDIGRFGSEQFTPRFSGNGVSLTLGLPQCENLSLSGAQPSFLSSESMPLGRRLEMETEAADYCSLNNHPSVANPSDAYESISIQDRKRFAAHLLPDFVA